MCCGILRASWLPTFHCYVLHPRIEGDAFALSMHPMILRRIANQEPGWDYGPLSMVAPKLRTFVEEAYPSLIDKEGRAKLTFTGKNVGSFDLQFLKRMPGWETNIRASHRALSSSIRVWIRRFRRWMTAVRERGCSNSGKTEGSGRLPCTRSTMRSAMHASLSNS